MAERDEAAFAARTAYMRALMSGAAPGVAFEVACARYRATWPRLREDELKCTVATLLENAHETRPALSIASDPDQHQSGIVASTPTTLLPRVLPFLRCIRLISVALLVATTACHPASEEWVKPGASAGDLPLARKQCGAQSGSYDFALDDRFTGREGVIDDAPDREYRAGSAQAYVYRDCMEDQGWRREPIAPNQQPK
jgi:hypothetical protein